MTRTWTDEPWVGHIRKDGGDWDYTIRTLKPHNPAGDIGKHIASVNKYLLAEDGNALAVQGNMDRIVTCVNECAPMDDPAVAIQDARDALENGLAWLEKTSDDEDIVPGGERTFRQMARAALAKLGPGK